MNVTSPVTPRRTLIRQPADPARTDVRTGVRAWWDGAWVERTESAGNVPVVTHRSGAPAGAAYPLAEEAVTGAGRTRTDLRSGWLRPAPDPPPEPPDPED